MVDVRQPSWAAARLARRPHHHRLLLEVDLLERAVHPRIGRQLVVPRLQVVGDVVPPRHLGRLTVVGDLEHSELPELLSQPVAPPRRLRQRLDPLARRTGRLLDLEADRRWAVGVRQLGQPLLIRVEDADRDTVAHHLHARRGDRARSLVRAHLLLADAGLDRAQLVVGVVGLRDRQHRMEPFTHLIGVALDIVSERDRVPAKLLIDPHPREAVRRLLLRPCLDVLPERRGLRSRRGPTVDLPLRHRVVLDRFRGRPGRLRPLRQRRLQPVHLLALRRYDPLGGPLGRLDLRGRRTATPGQQQTRQAQRRRTSATRPRTSTQRRLNVPDRVPHRRLPTSIAPYGRWDVDGPRTVPAGAGGCRGRGGLAPPGGRLGPVGAAGSWLARPDRSRTSSAVR